MKKSHHMLRSLRMLTHFLAAARSLNLHRASKQVSVTQSALSKSLQQLEADLGVKLFDRSVRGVALTKFGDSLYVRACRIEAECDLIERELAEMASGQSGSLNIGAGAAWSSVLLPQILVNLQKTRPSAHFTIRRSSGPQFAEQFANGEIDIGLGSLNTIAQNEDDFICEPLSTIQTYFLVHRDHRLHGQTRVGLEDMTSYPWSMFRLDKELHERIALLFTSNNLRFPVPALSVDSVTTVLESLRLSNMITCLPSPLLSLAKSFDVYPLPVGISPWTFQSGVVYRKTSLVYPLLQDLLDILHDQFGLDTEKPPGDGP